jgi:hypothetical protein
VKLGPHRSKQRGLEQKAAKVAKGTALGVGS